MNLQQFAYTGNPIIERVTTTATQQRAVSHGTQTVVLKAEPFNGAAEFDYSHIARQMYDNDMLLEYEDGCASVYLDRYCSTEVQINGSTYFFERGVLQHGESKQSNIILSQLWPKYYYVKQYEGYPLLLSIAVEEDTVNVDIDGELAIQDLDSGIHTIVFEDECEVEIYTDMHGNFEYGNILSPAPVHPFYIRWINRLGGWDTYMFTCNQRYSRKLEENAVYEPYLSEGVKKSYHKAGKEVVEVSSGMVDMEVYDLLSLIQYSPVVQRYEPGKGWYDVVVEECNAERLANQSKKELLITFELPTPQMQQ